MGHVGVEIERAFRVEGKLSEAVGDLDPRAFQELIAQKVAEVTSRQRNITGFYGNGAHCYLDGNSRNGRWFEQSTPPAPNGALAALYLRAEDLRLLRALPEASALVSEKLGYEVRIKAMDLAADALGNAREFHINLSCDPWDLYGKAICFIPMVMLAAQLFEGGKVVRSYEGRNSDFLGVPNGRWPEVARSSKAVWGLGEAARGEGRYLTEGDFGLLRAGSVERTMETGPYRIEIRWFGRGFGDRLTALSLDWLRLALDYTEEMVRQGRGEELHTVDNVWNEWRRLNGVKRDVPMRLRYEGVQYDYPFLQFNSLIRRNIEEVLTITPERRHVIDQWDALTRAIKSGDTYGITSVGSLEGALQRHEQHRRQKFRQERLTYEQAILFESLLHTVSDDPKHLRLVDGALGGIISRNKMFEESQLAHALAQPIPGTPGADFAFLVDRYHAHPNAKRLALNWATLSIHQDFNYSLHVRIDKGRNDELVTVLDAVAGATKVGAPDLVLAFAAKNPGLVEARHMGKRISLSSISTGGLHP